VSLAVKSVAVANVLFSIEAKRQLAIAIVSANGYHDSQQNVYEIHQELNQKIDFKGDNYTRFDRFI